jgi:hypothetical protein
MKKTTLKNLFAVLALGLLTLSGNTNAQTWAAVGSGVSGFSYSFVSALGTYNGNLYIGGYFTSPGNSVCKWNGTSLSSVGSGIYPGLDQGPQAFATFNSDLYIAGPFSLINSSTSCGSVVDWNGSALSPVTSTPGGTPFALTLYNSMLCAAGNFTTAGSINANYIATWNGSSWAVLGKGVSGAPSGSNTTVEALCVYNGNLYAGGIFDSAGGNKLANGIAMWNGTTWSTFGRGAISTNSAAVASVSSLVVFNGNLYAAGMFDSIGGVAARNVAEWNGTTWSALGKGVYAVPSGNVDGAASLCVYNGSLYAGGEFDSSGAVAAKNIAAWNGTAWSALGTGTDSNVTSMVVYNGGLYVGGAFRSAGGHSVNYLAEWTAPVSVAQISENVSVQVYPNPSNGTFFINQQNIDKQTKVEVYDILGEKVYQSELHAGETEIKLNNRSAGIYLYRILTQDGAVLATGRLVIQ